MTKLEGNPNDQMTNFDVDLALLFFGNSSFLRHSTFVLRHFPRAREHELRESPNR
jgi:hypothetical protein